MGCQILWPPQAQNTPSLTVNAHHFASLVSPSQPLPNLKPFYECRVRGASGSQRRRACASRARCTAMRRRITWQCCGTFRAAPRPECRFSSAGQLVFSQTSVRWVSRFSLTIYRISFNNIPGIESGFTPWLEEDTSLSRCLWTMGLMRC